MGRGVEWWVGLVILTVKKEKLTGGKKIETKEINLLDCVLKFTLNA
jgi:hypothetical protein